MFSARSKVRGTLEIYHAYIRDSDTSRGDADWEIVDNNSTTVSVSCFILSSPTRHFFLCETKREKRVLITRSVFLFVSTSKFNSEQFLSF